MKSVKQLLKLGRKNKYQLLEEKIKSLENRIFNEKKVNYYDGSWSSFFFDGYQPDTLEEEIMTLQDQVEVLAKLLKVKLVKAEAKDAEWTTKKLLIKRKK